MRRRALLASAVVPVTVGGSGCLSTVRSVLPTSVQLGWFGIKNADPESAHTFELMVERDEETVHESTHRLKAADASGNGGRSNAAVADCDWGQTAGDYTVRVRMDGTLETEESVTAYADRRGADCVIAIAEYRNHDAVSHFQDGKNLAIWLEDQCGEDGFVGRCSFTED